MASTATAATPATAAAANDNAGGEQQQPERPLSFLRRLLVFSGAIPMSPEEEAVAVDQLTDMFPQYDRADLLRVLRERGGSSEAVAEAILTGTFTGIPRGAGAPAPAWQQGQAQESS